ncbi:MAG: murein biosynthesis integral membrane protein MurJ [Rhodospirillaceae bacterium]|nr:murein biosynthesis integral membrane protein MurJ [Rhodospirillaceae bacterium]
MSLVRAMATVGGLTLVSRVAGFVRDILTAGILGAGPIADAFFVALKLPNLFRRLFAEGAFSVSFVPLYSAELETGGRRSADRFAENALAWMIAVLLPLTVVAMAAMPWIVPVIAPGFADDPERYGAAVTFARITFPYLVLMSLVALLGGVLNARDRFAPFASAPVLFNLTLIAALLVVAPLLDTAGHALSYAVTASGAVQLIWLAYWAQRAGVRLHLRLPRPSARFALLLRKMGPGALGAGAMQINLFFDTLLASLLPTGAISYLYYADRLYQLPLGVIGIAIGTALLPLMSRQIAAETAGAGPQAALATQNRALEYGVLLALPAGFALMAVPGPILTVLFERGAFDAATTVQTAAALAAYALGIPAYILVKVLSTAFFARQDTATPVRIAIACTGLNIALSFALIWVIAHMGIALATAVSAWLNVALLVRAQMRQGTWRPDARLSHRVPRLVVAAIAMGLVVLGLAQILAPGFAGGLVMQVASLVVLVAVGAAVYGGVAVLLGGVVVADLKALARRR